MKRLGMIIAAVIAAATIFTGTYNPTEVAADVVVKRDLTGIVNYEWLAEDLTDYNIPHYTCDGDHLDHSIQDYMYETLKGYGIEWFYEYMLCIAYQESSWNLNCLTGPDTGLLQYRSYFWEEWCQGCGEKADIWDPYAQIRVTAYYSEKRLAAGWSIEETISAHKTGGRVMDERYVKMVLDWLPQMIEEEK